MEFFDYGHCVGLPTTVTCHTTSRMIEQVFVATEAESAEKGGSKAEVRPRDLVFHRSHRDPSSPTQLAVSGVQP